MNAPLENILKNALPPLLLVAIPLLVFWQLFYADFVNWDDSLYVLQNHFVQKWDWSKLTVLFSPKTFIAGNYHPITILSYALETPFFAPSQSGHYHAVNIALHIVNLLLLYGIGKKIGIKTPWVMLLVLFYGIHPLRLESVAWISGRKDLLALMFSLLAVCASINKKPLIFPMALLLLAVLCKASIILIPFAFIPLLQEKQNGKLPKWILFSISFACIFGVGALMAQNSDVYLTSSIKNNWIENIIYLGYRLWYYGIESFLTLNIKALYGYQGITWPMALKSIAGYSLVVIFSLWFYKNRKHPMPIKKFGLLCFFAALIPILQFVPIGDAIVAERYTYISHTGLLLFSLAHLKHVKWNNNYLFLALPVLFFLGYTSQQKVKIWHNSEHLWQNQIKWQYNTPIAWINLAGYYQNHQQKSKAIACYQTLIALEKTQARAYLNLSDLYKTENQIDSALLILNNGIKNISDNPVLYNNRANLLSQSGFQKEALNDLLMATKLSPLYYEAWSNLSLVYFKMSDYILAEKSAAKSFEIEPSFLTGQVNYANALAAQKKYEVAIKYYEKAERGGLQTTWLYFNMGMAYYFSNNKEKACRYWELAEAEETLKQYCYP